MRTAGWRGWILLAGLSALVGCSGVETAPRGPLTSYLPPTGVPPLEQSVLRRGRPEQLLAAIAAGLERRGYAIELLDTGRGVVAASAGMPSDLVLDCGWIVERSRKAAGPVPAASPELVLARGSEERTVTRRLDAAVRVVVRAEPVDAERTLLTSRAYYVVIETDSGAASGRELVHFETGGHGTFAHGTRCQSNGRVEREALIPG